MFDRKRLAFGAIYGALLVAVALSGIEFLASFYVPAWPARALRSVPTSNPVTPTNPTCQRTRLEHRALQQLGDERHGAFAG